MNIKKIEAAFCRILGETFAEHFVIKENKEINNRFILYSENEKIVIEGDSGVSVLSGLNRYLREYLNINISWNTKKPKCPNSFPKIDKAINEVSPYKYRYYLNFCTYSYTMAFWDFERWEKELDIMALGGINLALSLIGQEAVIKETLIAMGFSSRQCDEYLTGPVHFAWFFMGNMTGFDGPLPEGFINDRVLLANKIHNRMKELGITPVLPGFYGIVPSFFKEIYPNALISPQGIWCDFKRPDCLSNEDDNFNKMADIYYQKQKELLGDITRFFTADPFHEGGRHTDFNLSKFGKSVMDGMKRYRNDAIWVIQAWGANPILKLFEQVNKKDVLILNLLSGRIQHSYEISRDFQNIPWVFSPVQNYGGRNALYGFFRTLAREPLKILKNPSTSLCGIGVMPEAIETNPAFYDLFWDMTYRNDALDINDWLDGYLNRRYGIVTENMKTAWQLLEDSVYNSFVPQPGGVESFICARPSLKLSSVSNWGPKEINYDASFVCEAARLMLLDFKLLCENENYLYDLVDVVKQALSLTSRAKYQRIMYLLGQNLFEEFKAESKKFLELILITDKILSFKKEFRIDNWLLEAYNCGAKYGKEKEFLRSAKILITVWGNETSSAKLHDYSCREWSGITATLYYRRWQIFFEALEREYAIGNRTDGISNLSKDWEDDHKAINREPITNWYDIEMQWVNDEYKFSDNSDCTDYENMKLTFQNALDNFVFE